MVARTGCEMDFSRYSGVNFERSRAPHATVQAANFFDGVYTGLNGQPVLCASEPVARLPVGR